ncbi:MAG: D-glycerate dehydrogenase [candidate division NC10 bacterium]|nr:D-glycerate dehydrogenase [candidate division NC10 bacterium]
MAKPTVLVTRPLPEPVTRLLRQHASLTVHRRDAPIPRRRVLEGIREATGLVCMGTDRIDAELLQAGPRLRVVANVAVGYNNVDVAAATSLGIWVTNTPGVLTETTADLAWALLLAVARRIIEGDAFVRSGRWKMWQFQHLLGTDVWGKTLGICGPGRIGQAVARRGRGHGMRILYTGRRRLPGPDEADLGAYFVEKSTLLKEADFVSLHLPLTPETTHYIGARELHRMKPTAFLINTTRGPVVDEKALVKALRGGWIAGAGLDVFEREPAVEPGLLRLRNVVLTPHVGSATAETRTRMALLAAENCVAVLRGERPQTPVNPEITPRPRPPR